jgi:transcriptional regulator with XRE-family HTH domain
MRNRLKFIRLEQKLSQEQLAKRCGISRVQLTMIENEKAVPNGTTIAQLVKATGVPAHKIFYDLDVEGG